MFKSGTDRTLHTWIGAYLLLVALIISQFIAAGDFSFGRKPWENFKKTAAELSQPSFLNIWFGSDRVEYRSDDGRVLRVENPREREREFLAALGRATWTTFQVATLGSLLAAVAALPFGLAAARNMMLPPVIAQTARVTLDVFRSIHTLVFGLLFVGVIGLGPMAGVLAIAAHSFGTYGKLYAESIETADARLIQSGVALGLSPLQTLVYGLWRTMLPRWISVHLYVWEFNVRDSTVLGLIGAGGLGLLLSEAVSLFQWGRLATILIAIVALVVAFDNLSRHIRHAVNRPREH
ncbi:MAG: phosphonate ABC transporter, permease protein PhnE [Betaproteobacteria bacterium]|jgi:phosphonate ABC transporter permease subunit PhnE|nr:phosphonate ABC transporter, permease protein PhnE [Betaproteobacteria bacterium]